MPPSGFPAVVDKALRSTPSSSLARRPRRARRRARRGRGRGRREARRRRLALNVLNEAVARSLLAKLDAVQDPSVLVVTRSGEVALELAGFVDRETVAQAAANAPRERCPQGGRAGALRPARTQGTAAPSRSCARSTTATRASSRPSSPRRRHERRRARPFGAATRQCRPGDAVRHRGGRGADGSRLRRPGAVGLSRHRRAARPPAALPRVSVRWAVGADRGASRRSCRRHSPGGAPRPATSPTSTCTPSWAARSSRPARHFVRGESAHFLPLLYPVLTAPAWLWDDVEQAYRTMQASNAVAMSLAAIPAFLLARRPASATGSRSPRRRRRSPP